MGTCPPPPPPPVSKRPCTMRCECNNGMLSLLLPHYRYHSTTTTGATIVLLLKLVWCSFCLAWGETGKRVLSYSAVGSGKNNNSPQILAGHPNHRNERIPVLHSYNKVGRHVRRKKSVKKRQEKKKKGKKRRSRSSSAHLFMPRRQKKKKRCVCDVKKT